VAKFVDSGLFFGLVVEVKVLEVMQLGWRKIHSK
jgi:hypothetical protein